MNVDIEVMQHRRRYTMEEEALRTHKEKGGEAGRAHGIQNAMNEAPDERC